MGKYRHLTPEDREQIAILRAAGWTMRAIAVSIGKSVAPFYAGIDMLWINSRCRLRSTVM